MGALNVDTSEYKAFAVKLKGADRKLAAATRREIRGVAKPLMDAVIQDGAEGLPASGGLADWTRQAKATLSMTATRAAMRFARSGHDLASINAGRLRHPVHGNRRVWVSQSVSPGGHDRAFEKNAETHLDAIERKLHDVMEREIL